MQTTSRATAIVVVLISILLPPVSAAGTSRVDGVIEGPALVRFIPSADRVEELCGISTALACTRVIGIRLDVACNADGARAQMRATAHFTPWILLLDLSKLTHEWEHIRDIRESLETYVTGIEKIRFDRLSDCEQAALRESKEFRVALQAFARASTVKRDGKRRWVTQAAVSAVSEY